MKHLQIKGTNIDKDIESCSDCPMSYEWEGSSTCGINCALSYKARIHHYDWKESIAEDCPLPDVEPGVW